MTIFSLVRLFVFILAVAHLVLAKEALYVQPEQIHLSLGESANEIVVTWTTFDKTFKSTVWYGTDKLDQVAYGTPSHGTLFTDGGPVKRTMYIHRVYLSNLKPDTLYKYHAGSEHGWSELFFFRTFPEGYNWSPRFVVYGDLGNDNARSMGRLQTEVQSGQYDLLMHIGDFAYNMEDDNAKVGDEFMRQIEPIAAYLPYQVCPGNHEEAYNFSNYNNRFTMHSKGNPNMNNFFWSYDIGPVHIISFTTEFHFFTKYGTHQIMNQYKWLEEDLKNANKPENRAKRPWIITMGHRPLYTQMFIEEKTRTGNKDGPGFEDLFYKYGVDILMGGHEHLYERSWPLYNKKVYGKSYTNPQAPIQIVTGSAGCLSKISSINKNPPEYTALVKGEYGFTRMNVINGTHIHFQQINHEQMYFEVIDDFYVIQNKHSTRSI